MAVKPEWFHHYSLYDLTSDMRAPYVGAITPDGWNAALMVWRWWVGVKQLEMPH